MASAAQWLSRSASLGLYPPPPDASRYAAKPLPPLPERRSGASSFSAEVTAALASPNTADDEAPFVFDWERETPGRSVRLSQSPGPDDLALMRLRKRQSRVAAGERRAAVKRSNAVSQRAAQRPAGLERTIARATAAPDPPPPRLAQPSALPPAPVGDVFLTAVPPDAILSPQPRSSLQKILQLTGNTSPTTSPSTDVPSLPNATQQIRSLTGLDSGPTRGNELQVPMLYEAISNTSSKADDGPENSYQESLSSDSYVESMEEQRTQRAVPTYGANTTPTPQSYLPDGSPSPVTAALRLSGFVAADVGVTTPGTMTPVPGRRDAWDEKHGDFEAHSSSSSEISAAEFELEPTAAELYHNTATSLAKNKRSITSSAGDVPSAQAKLHRMGWQQPVATIPVRPSRTSTQGSLGAPVDSVSPDFPRPLPPRHLSMNPFHKKHKSFSERRGHVPSPLDAAATATSAPPSALPPSRTTPYPPVASSIRGAAAAAAQETAAADDGQARLSLLARIFTSGSGSGSGSGAAATSGKRGSTASSSGRSSRRTPSVASASAATTTATPAALTPTESSWSPDTPSPSKKAPFGTEVGRHSAGLLSRTMDHARHAAGRKTKADKEEEAEKARTSLRAKIKVLKEDDGAPGAGAPAAKRGSVT